MAKPAQTIHAREVFREWMRHWDYFSEGSPDSRDVDAFLGAIIDGSGDVLHSGQESDALQVFEKPQTKAN
jgi:hypothetical protein